MQIKLTAYDKGWLDYERGLLEDENPYVEGTTYYTEWERGYLAAAREEGSA